METKIIGLLFAGLLFVLLFGWLYRREKGRRRICRMQEKEKWDALSGLTEPFGFAYEPFGDILVSHTDAWQRRQGYMALFDRLALKFNMVFDAYPVYFDYQDKTWMIEFWKGQYGISTGAEVGVYHANRCVPKEQRSYIQYNAVSENEMPVIGVCLEKNWEKLFSRKTEHWWQAAFHMGTFSQPEELAMYVHFSFADAAEAQALYAGLEEAGFSKEKYRIHGTWVSVLLDETAKHSGWEGIHRHLIQSGNRFFCILYRTVTLPFSKTADRMLFLYEQFPWCFKHMLRLHAFGKKHK